MSISSDIQKLNAGSVIELFELDLTSLGDGILRFHPGKNELISNITWQGNEYAAFPIQAEGFELSGSGRIPRPTVRVANVTGLVSAALRDFNDLVGAKVTRKRTLVKYLDAVNFSTSKNLLAYSENFDNTAWTKSTGGTGVVPVVSPNMTTSPDGTVSADRVVFNKGEGTTTTDQCALYQAVVTVIGQPYAASLWIKSATTSTYMIRLDFNGSGSDNTVTYPNLISVTPAWTRFSIVINDALDTSRRVTLRLRGAQGTSDYADVYVWGAQQELGSAPTTYEPSIVTFVSRASVGTYIGSNGLIQSAANNVARLQYTPSNLALPPKLLIEGSATNLLTYSEQFDNADWSKSNGSTITANAVIAPDGTLTGDKFIEGTGLPGSPYFFIHKTIVGGGAVNFSASMFVKSAERSEIFLRLDDTTSSNITTQGFDIDGVVLVGSIFRAGTVASSSASIENVGDGWVRITVNATFSSSPTNLNIKIQMGNAGTPAYAGDGVAGLYIWGAQLEVGSYSTSYIPTTSSTATRAADISLSDATNGNPYADPSQEFSDEVWFIDRKSAESKSMVEFELSAAWDVQGIALPRRQVVANSCPWKYRSAECSYAGDAVADITDASTTVLANDVCGKRLSSCKLRFGEFSVLPFGGFPAVALIR